MCGNICLHRSASGLEYEVLMHAELRHMVRL
jgi:hypothetical protein